MSREGMLGRLPLALYGLPNDRLAIALNLVNDLGGNDGPAWAAHLQKIRKDGLPDQPAQETAPKPSILTLVNNAVQLGVVTAYDPSGFKTRQGLWVSNEFQSRVGSKAKPVENLSAITLSSFDLTKNAYDKVVTADSNMPPNYKFESESEFVAYLDGMIQKQANGGEGDLLSNGYWNIFYVAGCVVNVFWYDGDRKWHVDAWKLDGYFWHAGLRAFSRNN